MKKRRITVWLKPHKFMDSEHGRITGEEWCKKEMKRIGKRTSLGENKRDEMIAIFRK